MSISRKCTEPHYQSTENASPWYVLYIFIGVMFFGFYLSNLFVGIVFETYVRLKAIKHTGVRYSCVSPLANQCISGLVATAFSLSISSSVCRPISFAAISHYTGPPSFHRQVLLSKQDQNWLRYEKHLRQVGLLDK